MTTDVEALKRSVTKEDYEDDPFSSPVFFMVPTIVGGVGSAGLRPWWSKERDFQLRNTVHMEDMWASAIFKAISKQVSLGWEIDDTGDSYRKKTRAQQLYLNANLGKGWTNFLFRHLRDFLLTDNGAFIEIIRTSSARGARIIGIVSLDSCRCTRTSDPERPVLYRDRLGKEHVMRDHQVITMSDMEDPSETYNGVGMCAASRAYHTISKLSAMEQYLHEKLTGDGATEISFVNGISDRSLKAALTSADEEQKRRGAVYYKGKILIPIMTDKPPEVATVNIKGVADGFNSKEERDDGYLKYANCIGVALQDIQPLSGQGIGTGMQTVILDEAAEGQGMAAWRKIWEQKNNKDVLPASTTFAWSSNDLRDQKAKADIAKVRADTRAVRIQSGEITPQEARQIAVDDGDLSKDLQKDSTTSGSLTDSEKPVPPEIVEDTDGVVEDEELDVDVESTPEFIELSSDEVQDGLPRSSD